ncbi:MAG TPA: hypothetical protein VJP85_13995 [Candidatus Baltobacteraceae bacterium]|nr:hypothetical protein [Candidatus Baltobacteraceae bacterium]
MLTAALLTAALAAPDPYDVYARARERWAVQLYPHYLSYDVKISGVRGGTIVTNTYASLADTQGGAIHVRATSAEESAHPYVPRGIDLKANLKISYSRHTQLSHPSAGGDVNISKTMRVTQREQYDLLGVPLLSPAYSFGLTPAQTISQRQPAPQGLRTIASITAVRRDYDIRYAGTGSIDGTACYRLQLAPRREPAVFRLRELWIDAHDFTTRQAIVQGNFTAGPSPALPWRIRFAVVGTAMYVEDETAMEPLNYLGRTFANVTVAFENVQPQGSAGSLWMLSMFGTSGDVLREP